MLMCSKREIVVYARERLASCCSIARVRVHTLRWLLGHERRALVDHVVASNQELLLRACRFNFVGLARILAFFAMAYDKEWLFRSVLDLPRAGALEAAAREHMSDEPLAAPFIGYFTAGRVARTDPCYWHCSV
eukprot:8837304-Alexandrium_andersonii.AAC.1